MNVHVQGGTGAGTRRPFEGQARPWRCTCPNPTGRSSRWKANPGYLVACPDCGARRPT